MVPEDRHEEEQQAIGTIVRNHREKLARTQEELAQALGVGQSMISQLEGGKKLLDLEKMRRLSEELQLEHAGAFMTRVILSQSTAEARQSIDGFLTQSDANTDLLAGSPLGILLCSIHGIVQLHDPDYHVVDSAAPGAWRIEGPGAAGVAPDYAGERRIRLTIPQGNHCGRSGLIRLENRTHWFGYITGPKVSRTIELEALDGTPLAVLNRADIAQVLHVTDVAYRL